MRTRDGLPRKVFAIMRAAAGASVGEPHRDERYCEILAGRRGADAGVEDLVIAEHRRGRVGLAPVIAHGSGYVDKAAREHQDSWYGAGMDPYLRQRQAG